MWTVQPRLRGAAGDAGAWARRSPIPRAVLEKCVADALQFNPKYGAGQDSFAALQRLVDRKDPSYRM